jgi:hypothetical protein
MWLRSRPAAALKVASQFLGPPFRLRQVMDLWVIQSPQMTTKAEPQLFIAAGIRERDVEIAVLTAPSCDLVRLFEKPEKRLVAAKPDDGFARSFPRFGYGAKQDVLEKEAAKVLPDLPEADLVVFSIWSL